MISNGDKLKSLRRRIDYLNKRVAPTPGAAGFERSELAALETAVTLISVGVQGKRLLRDLIVTMNDTHPMYHAIKAYLASSEL